MTKSKYVEKLRELADEIARANIAGFGNALNTLADDLEAMDVVWVPTVFLRSAFTTLDSCAEIIEQVEEAGEDYLSNFEGDDLFDISDCARGAATRIKGLVRAAENTND